MSEATSEGMALKIRTGAEDMPGGLINVTQTKRKRTKKKDRLISILLGTALCLSLSFCDHQGRYDITGTWHFFMYRDVGISYDVFYTFVGNEKQGQLDFSTMAGISGEYTVDADRVFFRVTAGKGIMWNVNEYNGVFITDDLMKGTLKGEHLEMGQVTVTWSGVWNARRVEGRSFRAIF
jgi:hypothetical protein